MNQKRWRTLRVLIPVLFGFVITGVAVSGVLTYVEARERVFQDVVEDHRVRAELQAAALEERFGRFLDVGVALATRVRFRQLVAEERWEEAVQIMRDVPTDFDYIQRVFLADADGVEWADFPHRPGGISVDFSYRDWYRGVSADWEPYISEAYRRHVEPQINLVAVSVPIRSPDNRSVNGILVFQIQLDMFFEWLQEVEFRGNATAYFVDKNGHIVAHPQIPSQQDLVDLSGDPIVSDVLSGASSHQFIERDGTEHLAVYAPATSFNWGVVVEQPTGNLFAAVNTDLSNKIIGDSVLALLIIAALVLLGIMFRRFYFVQQRERAFINSAGDALIALDTDWRIVLWNPTATEVTGWSQKEALGKPFTQIVNLVRERDRSENIEFIRQAMETGEKTKMGNHTLLIRKDGKEIPVEDSAAPIRSEGSIVQGVIIVLRDVSGEREAKHMQSSFTYASHQLRTPVTKVLWGIESALEEQDPSKRRAVLKDSLAGARILRKLVKDMNVVSEIERGVIIPRREPVDVARTVAAAVNFVKPMFENKNINMDTSGVREGPEVFADKGIFKSALEELLNNAVSYSMPGSKISVRSSNTEEGVLVEVEDEGIGIPFEEQPAVFTKFYRGHNIPDTVVGAGLGLYVCKSFVEMLDGKIWFKSEEGSGTTFFVLLPKPPDSKNS